MTKPKKKWWKILLGIVGAFVLAAVVYVAYVFLSYSRIEDNQKLTPTGNASSAAVEIGKKYTAVTYNVGFGAYTPDFTFFMDGGTQSWANSKDSVINCTNGVADVAKKNKPDIVLYQEVDTDSTRSYHVNQSEMISDKFDGFDNIFAVNYHSAFLMYPLLQPHGASNSGLLTLSDTEITSALRRSLPIATSLKKILDLDRCYSISRMNTENGKELVVFNIHASAYGVDAQIQHDQFTMLMSDMKKEYDKGNYVLCGGDFNHDFTDDSKYRLNENVTEEQAWAAPFPNDLIPEGFVKQTEYTDGKLIPTTRNCDIPYSEDSFIVILDGFITSDNIEVTRLENIDTGFLYSDHNPVVMDFKLKK